MTVVRLKPKPGSVEHGRIKGHYNEIASELRKCERELDGALKSLSGQLADYGGRFEYADFEAIDRKARRIAWIARQMLEADRGTISWDEAVTNSFVVSAPAWLDYAGDAPARKTAVEKRAAELRPVLNDICRPPSDEELKAMSAGVQNNLSRIAKAASDEADRLKGERQS